MFSFDFTKFFRTAFIYLWMTASGTNFQISSGLILILSWVMVKKWSNILWKSCSVNTARLRVFTIFHHYEGFDVFSGICNEKKKNKKKISRAFEKIRQSVSFTQNLKSWCFPCSNWSKTYQEIMPTLEDLRTFVLFYAGSYVFLARPSGGLRLWRGKVIYNFHEVKIA